MRKDLRVDIFREGGIKKRVKVLGNWERKDWEKGILMLNYYMMRMGINRSLSSIL